MPTSRRSRPHGVVSTAPDCGDTATSTLGGPGGRACADPIVAAVRAMAHVRTRATRVMRISGLLDAGIACLDHQALAQADRSILLGDVGHHVEVRLPLCVGDRAGGV